MKIKQTLCAALAALLIFRGTLPAMADETAAMPDAAMPEDTQTPDVQIPDVPTLDDALTPDAPEKMTSDSGKPDTPKEPPAFSAHIECSGGNGYTVVGTFTEFTADIIKIQPMYSLDGEAYRLCVDACCWNLPSDTEDGEDKSSEADNGKPQKLKNPECLVSNVEPLKSYLAGTLDRFYLKLCITRINGESYETNAVVIDRGEPQPLPEEIIASAIFDSSMLVIERKPPRVYGKYQLTVSENMSSGEIAAYLPGTVPVRVGLVSGRKTLADCTVDCPVTWKPFALPALTPGESVTIADAAEAVFVPAGTLIETPIGVFRLEEALGVEDMKNMQSDDIDLVLNVIAKDASPTGALKAERNGLELAFDRKPTGASSIQAYTCREGDAQWTKLPAPLSLDALGSQPKTENSGYAPVLGNDAEPYRSYLTQKDTGNPAPFFVGVVIEGGVYDKQQLILTWPGSYDPPLALPKLGGSGGNENNAGSDDKNDSTAEGQRPNLPENPSTPPKDQPPSSSGAQTEPGQPGSKQLGTSESGQSNAQPTDTPKPGQSDSQTPGSSTKTDAQSPHPDKPTKAGAQSPDPDKPGETNTQTPTPEKPAKTGTQTSGPNKPGKAGSQTPDPTGPAKTGAQTPTPAKTVGTNAQSTGSASPTKTDAQKQTDAENGAHTPPNKATAKKAGEADTPALPDPLSDDNLHMTHHQERLMLLLAAVALFAVCIARSKKIPVK